MAVDPINEEIRAVRRALAAKFDNDLSRIVADLKKRQATSGRRYVSFLSDGMKAEQGAEPELPTRRLDED